MSTVSLSGDGRCNRGLFGTAPGSGALSPSGGLGRGFVAGGFIHSRSERAGAAAMVAVLHGVVIALALFSHARVPLEQTPGLAAFDIATGQDRAHISHPSRRNHAVARSRSNPIQRPVIDLASVELVQPSLTAPVVLDIQPASFITGAGCDLTQAVQEALRRNVDLQNRLPDIPEDRRSIANAIVVWNAGWMDPGAQPAQLAFAAIRQTITQTVQASSADCRSQLQAGPRLIYLPGYSGKTTVLALGSGQWTWQQVAGETQPLPASEIAEAALPSAQVAVMKLAPPPATVLRSIRGASSSSGATPDLYVLLASLLRQRSSAGLPHNR